MTFAFLDTASMATAVEPSLEMPIRGLRSIVTGSMKQLIITISRTSMAENSP